MPDEEDEQPDKAIPLNDPEDFFSDWNDPEVDAAYGKVIPQNFAGLQLIKLL